MDTSQYKVEDDPAVTILREQGDLSMTQVREVQDLKGELDYIRAHCSHSIVTDDTIYNNGEEVMISKCHECGDYI